jgi:phosphatidylglycerol:prolipoprotein diacylglycerol transferase
MTIPALAALLPVLPALIPYFRPDEIPLGIKGLAVQPWGVMVAAGFMLGSWVCQKFAIKRGLDPKAFADIVLWMAGGALVFGHFGHIVYHPSIYIDDPIKILKVWDGLSSMGGFIGCTGLAIYFFKSRNIPVLRGGDVLMIGLAFGFFLGRMGCFIVHDHPGKAVDEVSPVVGTLLGPLAVDFPTRAKVTERGERELREGKHPKQQRRIDAGADGDAFQVGLNSMHLTRQVIGKKRFDLGLTDALLALALFGVLATLAQKPRREGLLLALTPMLYMPVRFSTDFLRLEKGGAEDAGYGGLTPAQYAAMALFLVGLTLLITTVRRRPTWPEPGTQPWQEPSAKS